MDDLRDVIIDVLDDLNADLNINPTVEARLSKLRTWHNALTDISDEDIQRGFLAISKTDLKFLPSSGAFRKFCTTKKARLSHDKDFVPIQDQALNDKNYQLIINRLKLPEKLKQDQFADFKKNRKTIELNRKERLKNASLRILHRD